MSLFAVMRCIISFVSPLGWLVSDVQGWAWLDWCWWLLILTKVRAWRCEGAFVVCSHLVACSHLSSPSVSRCFSSLMSQSINDWCHPVGLDSSFTCSLLHSCSKGSAPGPHAQQTVLHFLRSSVAFGKSKASFLLHHLIFFLCSFLTANIWAVPSLVILHENQCFSSVCAPPFTAIPRSTGRKKKHFLAAEAVIPCCQDSLYCRKLHLFLPSIVYWRPQRAQLCIFANQWSCIWLPMDQHFFLLEAKGEERLHKYVYPP